MKPLHRAVRITSILDAISYVLLVGVAMPKKYIGGDPNWVSALGRLHGAFFVALCLCLFFAWIRYRWPIRVPILVFLAALIPFVPFFLDRWICRQPTVPS